MFKPFWNYSTSSNYLSMNFLVLLLNPTLLCLLTLFQDFEKCYTEGSRVQAYCCKGFQMIS